MTMWSVVCAETQWQIVLFAYFSRSACNIVDISCILLAWSCHRSNCY